VGERLILGATENLVVKNVIVNGKAYTPEAK
jgi:hypothetical protein